jgi:hypothetical protein
LEERVVLIVDGGRQQEKRVQGDLQEIEVMGKR